ncbi:MAG: hypothetical protein QOD76_32 [Solirubrobacteraceae bacterium]|nr:hypothetical protein [Solirubrobacteraceae bacterium]
MDSTGPRAAPQHSTRCIPCEELELARVHDTRPVQTLPVPAAALAGFPEGRSGAGVTRRRLLQYGVAGFASVYGPKMLGWESIWEAAAAEALAPTNNVLVVLYLAGGNDGLNTIVPNAPADYNKYVQLRPAIHRGQGPTAGGVVGSMPIPATGGNLAFANPVVSSAGGGDNGDANFGFDTLYGDGLGGASSDLAILPAVDYMPPNLSHFESSDYWFSGALAQLSTGWLGRWLDAYGSHTNPLQAVSLDTALSKSIRTSSAPVCAISSFSALGFSMRPPSGGYGSPGGTPSAVDANTQIRNLAGVPAGAGNAHLARSRSTYSSAVDVFGSAGSLSGGAQGSGYPAGSQLAGKLKMAAQLLGANLGTRVVTIHWGSMDTHGGQISQQDPQLVQLSRCLGAFKADLQARGVEQKVATLVFSEFGRRVGENDSGGTDHGAGGLMLMSGSGVKGGYAAPFPGLGTLDDDGDVLVPTDFRSVYQAVINEWLGGDPAAVLPGGSFPGITRYDGTTGLFG